MLDTTRPSAETPDATLAARVDSVLASLDRDGYAIAEDLLDADAIATAADEVQRILDHTPYGRNPFEGHATRRIYAVFAKTRAFDGAATHPLVLGVLDRLLGEYHLSAPAGIAIDPGSPAQPLHTDDAIYPIQRPHVELVVNIMWPLMNFTPENGTTRIIPGSHRWIDERPQPDTEVVTPALKPGGALFTLGSTFHGGGANTTDETRVGVVLHYARAWLRPVENHVLAVPPETMRSLSPRLQELLGYNIATPFVGYVDGRHPKHHLESS